MKIIQRVEVTINLQEDQRQYFLIGHIQHHVLYVVWTTSNIQMEPFFRAGPKGQLYVDTSKWENGSTYDNTTSVTYSATTSNTGTLSFMLSCSGGMPASSADSVRLNLNTK